MKFHGFPYQIVLRSILKHIPHETMCEEFVSLMLHPSFGLLLNCQRPSNQSNPLQGCVDHKEPFIEVESIWPSKIEIYTEFSQSRNSPRKQKKTREGSSPFTAVPCHLFLRLSRSRYRPWQPEIRLVTSQVLRRLLYLHNLYKWWFEKKNGGNLKPSENSAGMLEPFHLAVFLLVLFFFLTVSKSQRLSEAKDATNSWPSKPSTFSTIGQLRDHNNNASKDIEEEARP